MYSFFNNLAIKSLLWKTSIRSFIKTLSTFNKKLQLFLKRFLLFRILKRVYLIIKNIFYWFRILEILRWILLGNIVLYSFILSPDLITIIIDHINRSYDNLILYYKQFIRWIISKLNNLIGEGKSDNDSNINHPTFISANDSAVEGSGDDTNDNGESTLKAKDDLSNKLSKTNNSRSPWYSGGKILTYEDGTPLPSLREDYTEQGMKTVNIELPNSRFNEIVSTPYFIVTMAAVTAISATIIYNHPEEVAHSVVWLQSQYNRLPPISDYFVLIAQGQLIYNGLNQYVISPIKVIKQWFGFGDNVLTNISENIAESSINNTTTIDVEVKDKGKYVERMNFDINEYFTDPSSSSDISSTSVSKNSDSGSSGGSLTPKANSIDTSNSIGQQTSLPVDIKEDRLLSAGFLDKIDKS